MLIDFFITILTWLSFLSIFRLRNQSRLICHIQHEINGKLIEGVSSLFGNLVMDNLEKSGKDYGIIPLLLQLRASSKVITLLNNRQAVVVIQCLKSSHSSFEMSIFSFWPNFIRQNDLSISWIAGHPYLQNS